MATAAAPWAWPNWARTMRAQVPRSVTTNLPVITASTYSASLQPNEILLSGLRSTTTFSAEPLVNGAAFEFCATTVCPVSRARLAAVTVSMAATLITLSAVAGVPVMYVTAPLFPDEATTTMPASAAFCAASASAVSLVPKDDPKDIFTTCMPFCTAQSSASTTTLVEPEQPKTRIE